MPIRFHVDPECQLVRVTVLGRVTADEILRYRRDLVVDPAFRRGMNLLVDASEVDSSAMTRGALESVAQDLAAMGPAFGPVRFAILVPSDSAYGLARMYEVLTEDAPMLVRAFREESAALDWIRASKTFS